MDSTVGVGLSTSDLSTTLLQKIVFDISSDDDLCTTLQMRDIFVGECTYPERYVNIAECIASPSVVIVSDCVVCTPPLEASDLPLLDYLFSYRYNDYLLTNVEYLGDGVHSFSYNGQTFLCVWTSPLISSLDKLYHNLDRWVSRDLPPVSWGEWKQKEWSQSVDTWVQKSPTVVAIHASLDPSRPYVIIYTYCVEWIPAHVPPLALPKFEDQVEVYVAYCKGIRPTSNKIIHRRSYPVADPETQILYHVCPESFGLRATLTDEGDEAFVCDDGKLRIGHVLATEDGAMTTLCCFLDEKGFITQNSDDVRFAVTSGHLQVDSAHRSVFAPFGLQDKNDIVQSFSPTCTDSNGSVLDYRCIGQSIYRCDALASYPHVNSRVPSSCDGVLIEMNDKVRNVICAESSPFENHATVDLLMGAHRTYVKHVGAMSGYVSGWLDCEAIIQHHSPCYSLVIMSRYPLSVPGDSGSCVFDLKERTAYGISTMAPFDMTAHVPVSGPEPAMDKKISNGGLGYFMYATPISAFLDTIQREEIPLLMALRQRILDEYAPLKIFVNRMSRGLCDAIGAGHEKSAALFLLPSESCSSIDEFCDSLERFFAKDVLVEASIVIAENRGDTKVIIHLASGSLSSRLVSLFFSLLCGLSILVHSDLL